MADSFDAIVIGMGPGGEVVASRLLDAGGRIAVVERELIGGECGYWACVPSKTLLRPPETRAEAAKAKGVGVPALDWPAAAAWRDEMTRHLDDNRQATQLHQIPERAVVLGGGPVGLELGQFLARYGCQVTLVQSPDRLINREDPRVGELVLRALEREGVQVRAGRRVVGAWLRDGQRGVELDDGSLIATDVVVVGAGRTPPPRASAWRPSGSSPASEGWRSTSAAGSPTGSGRSATSPWWRCSPRSPSTRAGWSPPTCSAAGGLPPTRASHGWCSPTRSLPPWA
jgi:dihydrolipoamide dehydrogenase